MILTTRVNIAGTEYPAGTDITGIATAGEIDSLRTAGVVRSQPERPAAKPTAEPVSPPEDVASADVNVLPGETQLSLTDLDASLVDLLAKADVHTVGDVIRYSQENKGLTKIKGIGKASESRIRETLGL